MATTGTNQWSVYKVQVVSDCQSVPRQLGTTATAGIIPPAPTFAICCTSSRVGAMMRAMGPSPSRSSGWSRMCRNMGSTKARVLPLPVLAMPMQSRPLMMIGSACKELQKLASIIHEAQGALLAAYSRHPKHSLFKAQPCRRHNQVAAEPCWLLGKQSCRYHTCAWIDSGRSKPCFFSTSSTLTLMPHCVQVLTGRGMSTPRTCKNIQGAGDTEHGQDVSKPAQPSNFRHVQNATETT